MRSRIDHVFKPCDGTGSEARYAATKYGECARCKKLIKLRKGTKTVRSHGTWEPRYTGR